MKQLFNFSTNWNNKLDCNIFTTLRKSVAHNVGDKGVILLKREPLFVGEIIGKNTIKLDSPTSSFMDFLAYVDTGYDWETTLGIIKKMYSMSDVKHKTITQYLIKRTKEPIEDKLL